MQHTVESPTRLGSFDIEGVLGEGGSAIVYAALDGDRPVALKVLRPDAGLEPREVDRFLDEADRMRRVSHPSLVPVLRAGLLPGGRPYIAMPRVRGKNLAERLSEGPFPLATALPLFEGVADAVASLHEAGLVHRDIKPENVLLTEDGTRLVLLDLGIARDSQAAPSTTTRAGFMRGTPAYMAPERFMGRRATEQSDIYELALLFYVMLTARLPWMEDDPRGRLEPKPPSSHGVSVSEPLSNTLLEALTIDVALRPKTVDDLVSRVRQAALLGVAGPSVRPPADGRGAPIVITPPKPQPSHSSFPPPQSPAFGQAATQRSQLYPGQGSPVAGSSAAPPPLQLTPHGWGPPPQAATPIAAPSRTSSSGALVAIGASIALLSALGGAAVVGWLVLSRDTPRDAPRARERDDDTAREARTERPIVASSASAVAPAPSASTSADPVAAPSGSSEPAAPKPGGKPGAPAASSTSAASAVPVVSGGQPAACSALIALMCDPSSGATPEECTAWKGNVQRWREKLPADVVAQTCQAALDQSRSGLAMRKKSPKPGGP